MSRRCARLVVCFFVVLVALSPSSPALADAPADWVPYAHGSGCYGGPLCRGNGDGVALRLLPLPVSRVRFFARDDVGSTHGGRLRVRIDSHLLARELDLDRRGEVIELDGIGLVGRHLYFEALGEEEVVVEDVEVLYGPPEEPLPSPTVP